MNNTGTSTFKRIFELAAAILLALIAWQIFGGIVMFAVRLILSIVVFGAVFSLIEWALFRRKNLTR